MSFKCARGFDTMDLGSSLTDKVSHNINRPSMFQLSLKDFQHNDPQIIEISLV